MEQHPHGGNLHKVTASLNTKKRLFVFFDGTLATTLAGEKQLLVEAGQKLQNENARLKQFEDEAKKLGGSRFWLRESGSCNMRLTDLRHLRIKPRALQGQNNQLQAEVDRLALFENQVPSLQAEKQQLQAQVDRLAPFETSTADLKKEKKQL
jgi:hypothetical protein